MLADKKGVDWAEANIFITQLSPATNRWPSSIGSSPPPLVASLPSAVRSEAAVVRSEPYTFEASM